MAEGKKSNGDGGLFWYGLAALVMVVMIVVTPLDILNRSLSHDRSSMSYLVGDDDEQEIYDLAESISMATGGGFGDLSIEGSALGRGKLGAFVKDRLEAFRVWVTIVLYRGYVTLMWLIVTLPLLIAIFVDAYAIREIRKETFVAQSPMFHRRAVQFATLGLIVVPLASFVPIHVPPLITPIMLVLWGWAFWFWIIHMQKRI